MPGDDIAAAAVGAENGRLKRGNETIHPSLRKRLGQPVELRSEHGSKTITYHPANLPIA